VTGLPNNMAAIEIAGKGGPEVRVPRKRGKTAPQRLPNPDQSGGERSQRATAMKLGWNHRSAARLSEPGLRKEWRCVHDRHDESSASACLRAAVDH